MRAPTIARGARAVRLARSGTWSPPQQLPQRVAQVAAGECPPPGRRRRSGTGRAGPRRRGGGARPETCRKRALGQTIPTISSRATVQGGGAGRESAVDGVMPRCERRFLGSMQGGHPRPPADHIGVLPEYPTQLPGALLPPFDPDCRHQLPQPRGGTVLPLAAEHPWVDVQARQAASMNSRHPGGRAPDPCCARDVDIGAGLSHLEHAVTRRPRQLHPGRRATFALERSVEPPDVGATGGTNAVSEAKEGPVHVDQRFLARPRSSP